MMSELLSNAQKEVFQSIPVLACMIDRHPKYIAANSGFAELFDASSENLIGKPIANFLPPELITKTHTNFRALDEGAAIVYAEVVLQNKHFLAAGHPIRRDGRAVAAFVTLTDITPLKETIARLVLGNEELLVQNAQLQELSETDALTSLANRRGLDRFLSTEVRRSKRTGRPISLALLDIDHFKLFNDRYGHIQGDGALKDVGAAIQGAIRRPGDCGARYGGEEFVIVLPETDLSGAEHVCRNIQDAVATIAIANDTSPFGRLTVSIGISGVATISREHDWTEVRNYLLQSADAALYHVKASGRNGVKVWRDEDLPTS